ncbi:hypothetical protein GQ44DRAFT_733841 [Phaeosphaeriaceae sp. PMI808]|nr:hypothetical protein GQ44DRAFT_733841 [Phaeosphaeriaceae sp. PMI808]
MKRCPFPLGFRAQPDRGGIDVRSKTSFTAEDLLAGGYIKSLASRPIGHPTHGSLPFVTLILNDVEPIFIRHALEAARKDGWSYFNGLNYSEFHIHSIWIIGVMESLGYPAHPKCTPECASSHRKDLLVVLPLEQPTKAMQHLIKYLDLDTNALNYIVLGQDGTV